MSELDVDSELDSDHQDTSWSIVSLHWFEERGQVWTKNDYFVCEKTLCWNQHQETLYESLYQSFEILFCCESYVRI